MRVCACFACVRVSVCVSRVGVAKVVGALFLSARRCFAVMWKEKKDGRELKQNQKKNARAGEKEASTSTCGLV